jgi:predicted enzyme related to lactoylglutathione lyase
MGVRRVVPDITSERFDESKAFYRDVLGFDTAMDLGWVVGFVSPAETHAGIQIIARDATAPVNPAVSIQVDEIDAVCAAARRAGATVVYPMTLEPWGVRRFFVEDPNGVAINVMTHAPKP